MISYNRPGALTGVPIGDVTPLLRDVPSPAALQLSVELAADAYALSAAQWLRSGWRDVSFLAESGLIPGVTADADLRENLTAVLRLKAAQLHLKRNDPIINAVGAVGQLGRESSTGKAIVMAHRAPDGRHVIGIGFMGTGIHLYDWLANLRMGLENGLHRGFLELTRRFEALEGQITFPDTARELGLERLTLADVLASAAKPDSPFRIWLAGHSQGGALVQIYALRKLTEERVLPQHLIGYGFASPRAASAGLVSNPHALPVWHVINSDDAVPACGADIHLGKLLRCEADAELRTACYSWPMEADSVRARALAKPFCEELTDMAHILLFFSAYLKLAESLSPAELREALGGSPDNELMGRLAGLADPGLDAMLRLLREGFLMRYREVTGDRVPVAALTRLELRLKAAAEQCSVRALTAAFFQLLGAPHGCAPKENRDTIPAYPWITLHRAETLRCGVWTRDILGHPCLTYIGKEA